MEIGDKIKYYRNQKGMTQEELSEGICTRAYLSKIENNVLTAHQNTIIMLLEKLGIARVEKQTITIGELNRKLEKWYEVIKSRDKQIASDLKNSIDEDIKNIEDPAILIQYQVFSIRYYLLLRNLDESEKIILQVKKVQNNLSNKQKYYFYQFHGLYKYMKNDLIDALEYYLYAEKTYQTIDLNEPELFYLIALTHSRLHHVTLAIHYARIALDLFNENMDFTQSIESQSVLAINYIRIREFKKAKHHLENSLKLAEKLNDSYLISNIFHNLGYLYAKNNKHNIAVDFYLKSIPLRKKEYRKLVNTIYYLTESYYALADIVTSKKWLEKGLKISLENKIIDIQIKYCLLKLELYNEKEKSINFLIETALPYLEEKQNWKDLSTVAERLANYYANRHYYKQAYNYSFLAIDAIKKIEM